MDKHERDTILVYSKFIMKGLVKRGYELKETLTTEEGERYVINKGEDKEKFEVDFAEVKAEKAKRAATYKKKYDEQTESIASAAEDIATAEV